jgi:hypothetical protein
MDWQLFDIGTTLLGTVLGAVGEREQGQQEAEAARYQASIYRYNAGLARKAAADRLYRGRREVQARQYQREQEAGETTATYAARGVKVNQDVALAAVLETIRLSKLDEITLADNAKREALAIRQQGQNYESYANLTEAQGANAAKAGNIRALGTLIGGAGAVASKWMIYNNNRDTETFGNIDLYAKNTHTAGGYI